MPASPEPQVAATVLPGVAALARDYDAFIVDQWGILHDGAKPYPGAIECLEHLRAAGKHVVLLSNTGRREAASLRSLASMGFDARLVDRCISAGEVAREALQRRSNPFHAQLGRRYYAFTRDDDVSVLEGLPFERVARVADADFLAVIGIDSPPRVVADYEAPLAEAAARHLPMLCANPDIKRPSPQGLLDAPGGLAQRYEQLGGKVFYHGKPHPGIYASCLAALPEGVRGKAITIGDSVEHDVLGATRAGLPCAFVAGGIHSAELGIAWGELPGGEAWNRFLEGAVARPTHLLPAFVWGE